MHAVRKLIFNGKYCICVIHCIQSMSIQLNLEKHIIRQLCSIFDRIFLIIARYTFTAADAFYSFKCHIQFRFNICFCIIRAIGRIPCQIICFKIHIVFIALISTDLSGMNGFIPAEFHIILENQRFSVCKIGIFIEITHFGIISGIITSIIIQPALAPVQRNLAVSVVTIHTTLTRYCFQERSCFAVINTNCSVIQQVKSDCIVIQSHLIYCVTGIVGESCTICYGITQREALEAARRITGSIYQHITACIDNPLFRLIIAGGIFCGFNFIGLYSVAVISTLCPIDDFSSRTSFNCTSNGNCHLFARCKFPVARTFHGIFRCRYCISNLLCPGFHIFQRVRNCIRKCHAIRSNSTIIFYNNSIGQGISCHIGRRVHCLRNPQLCFRHIRCKPNFIGRLAVYRCHVENFFVHAVFDCTSYRDLHRFSSRNVNFTRKVCSCNTIYGISHILQIV